VIGREQRKGQETPTLLLKDVTITKNSGEYHGGLTCEYVQDMALENVVITGNSANAGGGISCYSSTLDLSDVVIAHNSAGSGGGIYCLDSDIEAVNVSVSHNRATDGGGIYFDQSVLDISGAIVSQNTAGHDGGGLFCKDSPGIALENCLIYGNSAERYGGGVKSQDSDLVLMNTTVFQNSAGEGGGGIHSACSNAILVNSIFWENAPQEIYSYSQGLASDSIAVAFCDVAGAQSATVVEGNGVLRWFEGNIDTDPLFASPAIGDFHLLGSSPCVGAGTSSIEIDGTWYYAPPTDIDDSPRPNPPNSRPDMGAYEGESGVDVDDSEPRTLPAAYTLGPNQPNPFNLATTIPFEVPERARVTLRVYDSGGRVVKVLVNRHVEAGYHSVLWDAVDVSPGLYVFRMTAGGYSESGKSVLIR